MGSRESAPWRLIWPRLRVRKAAISAPKPAQRHLDLEIPPLPQGGHQVVDLVFCV